MNTIISSMTFDDVLAGISLLHRFGQSPHIRGLEYDSRRIRPDAVFVAMRGETTDGNRYLSKALELGAAAVITDSAEAFEGLRRDYPETAAALVAHGRNALAQASANFYMHPEHRMKISGVTGTNGKTTTAYLLDAILNHVGRKTVLLGTIECRVAGVVRPSAHTTPESRDLYELLRDGVDAGASEAVMEVSSHALEQGRVFGVPYDVAIFTNLTRDHLDFHGTMENYFAAKRRLFDGSLGAPPRVAVINADDPYGERLVVAAKEAVALVYSYGLDAGEFRAADIEMKPSGMRFTIASPSGSFEIASRLTGKVNVYNLLAACAAAAARGLSPEQIQAGVASLDCVPGRFQTVDRDQPFTVVVDYAHTDDALRNLTALAREFVTASGGRVLTLFGCGGDRDRAKRPLMGRAAGEASDFVILTSDNPRSEDPLAIIADALPGLEATGTKYAVEPDRAAAIRLAVREARAGDIVLLAGKGHEKTQTIGAQVIPFDDAAVATAALEAVQNEVRA
ncbi:UDP-N-acetylmuramoyl-L-alanyl-D-glutamate--2,6-diaminopimelate ligase [Silvibacterium sp.]|uniref:UDP-N-acetylmuramoyl-L-alanyl-D-glutamate--2, 6-diaminopimelate ligase n=1 Tax=Silvibacterium sp. TaxID=1964179 RepID=UPI0039E64631